MKFLFTLFLVIGLIGMTFAQDVVKTKGSFSTVQDPNETEEQAKQRAYNAARVNAVENAFGTNVSQESNLTINNGKSYFSMVGNTKVGADIREVLDEVYTKKYDVHREEMWITCNVEILATPATPKADIEVSTLSLPDPLAKTEIFKNGNELYICFKSPVKGFLSIYLDDYKNIYKLLPYHTDTKHQSTFPVEADQEYIFFSKQNVYNDIQPKELELTTLLEHENNFLHIFFSEKDYTKPVAVKAKQDKTGEFIPESVTRKDFQKWMEKNQNVLRDFINLPIAIQIIGE